ncbi:hypothetical protein TNCV_2318421 [Trichonephila clavipes]|nr:hypothetical protein TNCV_2318421 [Trichonephila clavipes]
MTAVGFLHHGNPSTWAGVEPTTLGAEMAQQSMRARACCAHPSIRDHWVLRCMSRYSDQVVSHKRDPQCLSPQASLVLFYRHTAVGMKGRVDLV